MYVVLIESTSLSVMCSYCHVLITTNTRSYYTGGVKVTSFFDLGYGFSSLYLITVHKVIWDASWSSATGDNLAFMQNLGTLMHFTKHSLF